MRGATLLVAIAFALVAGHSAMHGASVVSALFGALAGSALTMLLNPIGHGGKSR